MTTSKHPKTPPMGPDDLGADVPRPPDDLERNPGIGASKGAFAATGEDPETIEGKNTTEGDVASDVDRSGGLDPDRLGRTNK